MDTAQWPQEIVVKPMEEIVPTINNNNINNNTSKASVERKVRPQKDEAVNCPRCNSTNTKFCYYNNYSLSQPRYFCKTCRRYWTEGGSLRNIPVGGGSRKNKRSSSSTTTTTTHTTSSSSSAAVNKKLPDLVTPVPILHHHQNPSKIHEDLNLGFTHQHHQDFKTITELIQVPNYETNNKEGENHPHRPSPSSSGAGQLSALELLTGMTSSRGLMSSFIPMPIPDPNNNNNNNSVYSSFHLPDFKPSLNFSLDGIGNGGGGYGTHHHTSGGSGGGGDGRLFFPFEDLRSGAAPDGGEQDKDNNTPAGESTGHGYWNGVLGAGGGSW